MALDRYVMFPHGKGPTAEQVELVVRNFFGGGARIEQLHGHHVVTLPGKPTWTFEGIEPDPWPRLRNEERIIEVSGRGATVMVTTRRADEYTNVVSRGLAKVFGSYWDGEVEHGE